MSQKVLTILLAAAPYSGESASTAVRLAGAALDAGHQVNLFASADAVYAFTTGHRVKGIPDVEVGFRRLIERGLRVELCGSCLTLRGLPRDDLAPGAQPSSMPALARLIRASDVVLTLGN
jgi:tRNA 2-thiouridine synthesizing protein D